MCRDERERRPGTGAPSTVARWRRRRPRSPSPRALSAWVPRPRTASRRTARGPSPTVVLSAHRSTRGGQRRPLRRFRRRHRVRDGRRALRLVVRVPRLCPPTTPSGHARGGRPGGVRSFGRPGESPRVPATSIARPVGPSGGARVMGRRGRLRRWAGGRLPYRGGVGAGGARRPRTAALSPGGTSSSPAAGTACNVWQGELPEPQHLGRRPLGTAPVDAYRPNGFGLHSVHRNVWEWCGDRWRRASRRGALRRPPRPSPRSPEGHERGSYLCHASYCNRYRVAARTASEPDSSTGNTGFRCAWDA